MATDFDPYHKWLAIPPAEQPPNYYRLLGVPIFEADHEVVANAADRQMAHVRTCSGGKHSDLSQRLLNELASARLVLLDPTKRPAYDAQLKQAIAKRQAAKKQTHAAAPATSHNRAAREAATELDLGLAPLQSDFERTLAELPTDQATASTKALPSDPWGELDTMVSGLTPAGGPGANVGGLPKGFGDLGRWANRNRMGAAALVGTFLVLPVNLLLRKPLTGVVLLVLGILVVSLLARPKSLVALANFFRLAEEWVGVVMFYAIAAFLVPVLYAVLSLLGVLPAAVTNPEIANLDVLAGFALGLFLLGVAIVAGVVKMSRRVGLFPGTAGMYLAIAALVTLVPGSPLAWLSSGHESAVALLTHNEAPEEVVSIDTEAIKIPVDEPAETVLPSAPEVSAKTAWRVPVDPSASSHALTADRRIELNCKLSEVRRVGMAPAVDIAVVLCEAADDGKWRLDRYDLGEGKLSSQVPVSDNSVLLDLSSDGSQVLLNVGDIVEVRTLENGTIKGQRKIAGEGASVKWGGLIHGTHFALLDATGRLTIWAMGQDAELFGIDGVTAAALTPGRNYLIAFRAADHLVAAQVFDAKSGKLVGELEAPTAESASFEPQTCAVHHGGEQIVVQGSNRLLEWDLTSGKLKSEVSPAPNSQSLQYIDPGQVLLDGRLYELRRKSMLCRYTFQSPAHAWNAVVGNVDGNPWVLLAQRSTARASLIKVGLLIQVGGTLSIEQMINYQILPEQSERLVADSEFVEFSWRYPRELLANLICGDDAALVEQLRWSTATQSVTLGRRWGVGVTLEGKSVQPVIVTPEDMSRTVGPIGVDLGAQLQTLTDTGEFGVWPKASDKRLHKVALLGGGKPSELAAAARRQGLDVLMLLSIEPKTAGFGKVMDMMDMSLRVKIMNVDVAGETWISKPLSAAAAKRDPAAGKALAREVQQKIRDAYGLAEIPAKDAVAAKDRVREQLKKDNSNPLPLIAEVRYYQAKNLLTGQQAAAVFDRLVGKGNGQKLASGTEPERRELLEKWLVQ